MKINLYTVLLLSVIALSWTDSYTDQEQEIERTKRNNIIPLDKNQTCVEYQCLGEPTLAVWHMLSVGRGFMYCTDKLNWEQWNGKENLDKSPEFAAYMDDLSKSSIQCCYHHYNTPGGQYHRGPKGNGQFCEYDVDCKRSCKTHGENERIRTNTPPYCRANECEAAGEYRLGALIKKTGFTPVNCDYEWDLTGFEHKNEWDQDIENYAKSIQNVRCCYPKNEEFNWKENEYITFSNNCTLEYETRQS